MIRNALLLIDGHIRGNGRGQGPPTSSNCALGSPTQYDYLASEGFEAIRVETDNLDALTHECCRRPSDHGSVGATVGKLWPRRH
ncbi:MAG: hypothetical protein EOR47_22655 [Mesorhizobium sp.]|nr:MAG: hypothetical protein EOR47_22655 [Mesorhizobium sp.]